MKINNKNIFLIKHEDVAQSKCLGSIISTAKESFPWKEGHLKKKTKMYIQPSKTRQIKADQINSNRLLQLEGKL